MSVLAGSSLAELEDTQELLQRAHDCIECNGFNIWAYEASSHGPMCYIGTVRRAAHVGGSPGSDPGRGNGPELRLALQVLDAQAMADLSADHIQEVVDGRLYDGVDGRYVEQFGFMQAESLTREEQQEIALGVFRGALTEVYKMINDHNDHKED